MGALLFGGENMATIKGITVQIGSDTTGLQAALKDVNQHSREIASELRQVERLLKFNPHDTELLAQKQQLLSEQVDNTRKKLDTLKTAQEQVNEQLKKGEISEEQHRAFQRELIKTESQLKNYEKQLRAVNIESDAFKVAMDKVGESLEKAGKKMADIGKNLSLKVTAPIVALGAAVTKAGADFDAAMTQSTAIMGDLSDEMRDELSDTAREIGTSTKFSATEAAEAYEFLASAGYDAERAVAALPRVAAFAQAANADLARATTLLADAQSALGLASQDATENMENMARVSDVLVLANTLANATTEQFSEALTNKAAAALRLVNKDVEEGVAVLAALADQGVKGAAAGEQLNIVMRDLQKAAIKNEEAFADANITVFDSSGNMRNLADIIGDLEDRFDGMSDEQKRAEMMMLGFQDRSVGAMMTLMGTSDAIRDYQSALEGAGGTTDDIAQKKLKDFWTQLDLLKKKVIDIGLTIWEDLQPILVDHLIPALERGAEKIKALSEWFSNLDPRLKNAILLFVGIVAAVGPVLLILGKLISGVGSVLSTLGTLVAFFKTTLIPALSGISLTTVATVGAIAAVALVAYEVYRAWDEVKALLIAVWDLVRAHATNLGLSVSIAMEEMKHATLNAVNAMLERLVVLEKLPFGIGEKFAGMKEGISKSADDSAKKIADMKKAVEANQKEIAGAADRTKVAFSDLGKKIADDVGGMMAKVTGIITGPEGLKAVEDAQAQQTDVVHEESLKRIEIMAKETEEMASVAGDGMAEVVKALVDGGLGAKGEVEDMAEELAQEVADRLMGESPPKKGPLRDIDEGGYIVGLTWGEALADGITASMGKVESGAGIIASRLKEQFGKAFDEIGKTVEKTMVDVGNMLLSGGGDWKQILVGVLSAVINQIIVAAVAAMGIAELVSKALSQMWNPLGWVVIAGLLVALAAIRNSLASQLSISADVPSRDGTAPPGGGGRGASESRPSGGRQISEITGPSRDLLTDLLAPLAHLSQIVAPIQDIRNMLDARLPHPGELALAGAVGVGGVSVTIQTLSINAPTATVGDIGKLTIDEIERALASRLAFGRRGRAGA